MNPQNSSEKLDQATSQRLARLGSMPVDTSRLDRMIQSHIPRPAATRPVVIRISAVRAVAASIFLAMLIGVVVFSLSGGQVLASPDMMARFHNDMVSGKVATVQVDSIADANTKLAEQWQDGVALPNVPSEHTMLCCMRQVKDKRVACVLLRSEGVPVTLAVAKAMDMKMPTSRVIKQDGATFHVQSSGDLNMVMAERDGRWICLIGALPNDRLIGMAKSIQF